MSTLTPSNLSDDTVVIPPTSQTAVMPPLDLSDDLHEDPPTDPDSEQAETALYPCGTVALGQYEPCAHSSVQVLCCACAGCSRDIWSCGRQTPRPDWSYYEAAFIARLFGRFIGVKTALWFTAIMIIAFLCTQIPYWALYLWYFLFCCGIASIALSVGQLLSVLH